MEKRRHRLVLCALAGGLLLMAQGRAQADEAARALVKQVLEALPKAPLTAKMKLTVADGATRELELNHKLISGARANYLEVKAPAELAGIRFLFLQPLDGPNEQYIKVAASRSVVQVSYEIRTQPFLGSTFYVSDLVEPKIGDFDYTFVGEEEVLGRKCKLVQATPKNPAGELYSKTVLALDPTDLLILKRQFFDTKGQPVKVWTIDKVDKIDGNWTLLEQTMTNVQEKASSKLEIQEIKYGVELKDMMFTPKYLLR